MNKRKKKGKAYTIKFEGEKENWYKRNKSEVKKEKEKKNRRKEN